ncbi:K+ channel protein [Acanthamoeba castellanii str. Neff]|uniref:K+ channel protein n=1 Tax=Acanthamoeba castellanii (strain ATCC 30010 / Neff) TaxID=1257118 RepID=M0QSM5_ACACF|nr:K+ channel protein [Acanthamoeba castellanii str. Neff]ELR16268.1 K+ channel protein [Acanthamoeba castellanii str. Neff]
MGSSLPPIFESPTSSAPFLQKTGRFSRCWSRWSGRRSGWTPLHDSTQCRLITRENPYKFNLQRRGAPIAPLFADLYHALLDTKWWKLLIGLCLFFFVEHLFFAFLYYQDRGGLGGLKPSAENTLIDFWTCFFFSVQTMQTIGYGGLSPESVYCNVLVCIQAFWGMLSTAIITGFVFAKIGRPSRQKRNIMFSELAVVNNQERYWYGNPDRLSEGYYVQGGAPCFVLRFSNTRHGLPPDLLGLAWPGLARSQVCEPRFRLLMLRREPVRGDEESERWDTGEEEGCIRVHELNYEIHSMENRARGVDFSSALLPLPWTVVHAMDERSPLHGATPASLAASDTEIIAILDGTDEGCSEQLQARWSYTYREIIWDARLVPVVSQDKRSGKYVVDLSRFHDITPIVAQPPSRSTTKGKHTRSRPASASGNIQEDDDRLI